MNPQGRWRELSPICCPLVSTHVQPKWRVCTEWCAWASTEIYPVFGQGNNVREVLFCFVIIHESYFELIIINVYH